MQYRSRSVVLLAGLLVSAGIVVRPVPAYGEEAKPSAISAKSLPQDPLDLIEACYAKSQTLDQFTQNFTKRERLEGKLGETEKVFIKFRSKPLSIYMRWTEDPHQGREVIYLEGQHENKAVLHEYVGPLNVLVKLDPAGAEARKKSLRPITDAGIRNATKSLRELSRRGRQRGDMRLGYVGMEKLNGRDVCLLCRTMDKRDDYCAYVTLIYVDLEYMLPVKVVGYDWDYEISWIYESRDIKTDVTLTDGDFDPKNPEYDYPGGVIPKLSWPFGKKK